MRSSLLPAGTTLAILSTATIAFSNRREDGLPLIHASVTTQNRDGGITGWGRRQKRQATLDIGNEETGTVYIVDLEIGTPSQNISVVLDTGSEKLWVNAECDTSGQPDYCESFPQFDYTKSSTLSDTGIPDYLAYGKGEVLIEYVTDVVGIGSASIDAQIFGIGIESEEIPLGILGLAPAINGEEDYPYVLDNMVTQGLISSRAFSLDLRDVDDPDGSIIFGGVDTGKYVGSLEKCPMLDPSETPSGADRYWITMTSVGVTLSDGESGLVDSDEIPVFLDSGGTLTRLPTAVFTAIGNAFAGLGAQYVEADAVYALDCDVRDKSGSVDFGFNGKIISVSLKDFIWQDPESGYCVLGITADDDEPVLGDSFLRAAYVVYDQDNRNLHLAQAANCGSNLIAIGSGKDAVPSSTGDCTATSAGSLATGTLTADTSAPTVTSDIGGLTSALGPGPGATGSASSITGTLCLTCSKTATSTAGAKHTSVAGAAVAIKQENSPFAAVVGVAAVAAWLV